MDNELTISNIIEILRLKTFCKSCKLPEKISGAYVSDLLSDVMGNAIEGTIWITLQTHKNIVAIASLKDIAAVILVKGMEPDEDALVQAEKDNVLLLGTEEPAFEIAGKLYALFYPK